ncbi:34035_t:CDS:2, partial [Gigaspora margarita]
MFALRNRLKKSTLQQSYNIRLRAKKTYLDNYNVPEFYNLDYNINDLNYTNPQDDNGLNHNDQQLNNSILRSNHDQIYSDDQQFGGHNTDLELSQEFEFDDLNYDNSEDAYSKNEFNTDVDCSSDNESEPISTNIDDLPKTFDGIKCNLTTAAYQDLIQILLHPNFEKNHLTINLQKLKKQREHLPLMKIQSHMVPISAKNTPSTTKNFTRVYFFSLIKHLQRILKNPSLSSQLYFGPGVFSKSCEELWEGDLWAESPLFGQPNLITTQGSFNCGNFVRYKSVSETIEVGRIRSFVIINKQMAVRIQRLLSYEQISQYLSSKQHISHSPQERYLVEEFDSFIIDPSSLICHINVWLQDQPALPISDFF